MIASVCLSCFRPNGCRKPGCAFQTQNWKAPLMSLSRAASLHVPNTAVVVSHDDPFKMWDYDKGWDLDVRTF